MWPYFAPYKWLMFLAIIASIITASTNGALAVAVKYVFDNMFKPNDYTYLYILPIVVVLIYVAKSSFLFMQGFLMSFVGNKVIEKLRNETFEKMVRLPVKYYSDQSTGALMSRITNDINLVQSSIPTIISMFRAVLTMIGLIGVIFYMNYQLAIIAIIMYPIFIFPLSIISKKLRKYSHLGQERMGDLTSVLQESFSGIRVVKTFVAEGKEITRFEKANDQTIKYANKSVLAGNLASPLTEALGSFGIGAVLLMGGYQVISGTSTTGEFLAFLAALIQIYEPVKLFANSNNALQASIAATDRVFSMFDEEDEVIENKGRIECHAEGKDIEFKNVSFKYKDDVYALKNISFKVKAGSTVAFVGPSGAGKTTVAHLIPRFYDVTDGAILIGGIDIKDYDLYSLRHNIATVSQDAFLFNDTIRSNISYSKENASDEEIKNAAIAAYADEFIEKFPEKYETLCGERGVKLSGGQKQRVALARALIHRPGLLLLDEPLGALDALTRLEMQDLIVSLWQEHGFTVLLVTHDVSEAVAMADRVLLIEEGKIGLDLTVDIPRPRRLGSVRLAELEAEVLQRVMQRGESETRLRKQG